MSSVVLDKKKSDLVRDNRLSERIRVLITSVALRRKK